MLRSWGFLCRLRFLHKVCWHSLGKSFFFNFCDFCGPTLGHVSRHVGTCHVGVLHIKWKVMKNWCVWPPRFWKSDQIWGSYGLDNENILNSSLKSPYHIQIKELVRAEMMSAMRFSGYFHCQGHNSLNFGPIFKILVAKHISFSRPFILCAEHPCGTCPRA